MEDHCLVVLTDYYITNHQVRSNNKIRYKELDNALERIGVVIIIEPAQRLTIVSDVSAVWAAHAGPICWTRSCAKAAKCAIE